MLLKLFLVFLKIGAVSFGGGYAMISLIKEECLINGWLTEEELLNFIAVSESTPGSIAVNIATLIGTSQNGFLGSLFATLGVILPSFIIILLVLLTLNKLLNYNTIKAFLNGVQPAIIGLVISTAVILFINIIFSITTINSNFEFNVKSLIIFIIIIIFNCVYKLIYKKEISPILLIVFSGIIGILF